MFSEINNYQRKKCGAPLLGLAKSMYYMAELVRTEEELSDWFPERSKFSFTDC